MRKSASRVSHAAGRLIFQGEVPYRQGHAGTRPASVSSRPEKVLAGFQLGSNWPFGLKARRRPLHSEPIFPVSSILVHRTCLSVLLAQERDNATLHLLCTRE